MASSQVLLIYFMFLLWECGHCDTGPACNNDVPALPSEMMISCSLRCAKYGYEIESKDYVPYKVPYSQLTAMNFTEARCVDRQPPRFTRRCPHSMVFLTTIGTRSATVKWRLKAVDNSGSKPQVNCSHDHGEYDVGEYDITCHASDGAGNMATCEFHVSVRSPGCPSLGEPANGNLRCDEWQFGSFCYQECEKNYDVPPGSMFPNLFVCGSSGLWTPSSVPDCVLPTEAKGLVLRSHLQMYSDVCDDATRAMAERGFLNLLNRSDVLAVCQWRERCSIQNITVDCGPAVYTTETMGADMMKGGGMDMTSEGVASPNQLYWYQRPQVLSDVDHYSRTRRAPSPDTHNAEYVWRYTINVTFSFALNLSEALLEDAAYDWLTYLGSKELYDSAVYMQTQAESNMIGLQIPDLDWAFQKIPFNHEFVSPYCEVGYMPSWKTMKCSACVAGTYYNTTLHECLACPLGSYQDGTAQAECKPCPSGTTLADELSDSVQSCR